MGKTYTRRKNDGGMAYPRAATMPREQGSWEDYVPPVNAMSLRDWFAGMALQGYLAAQADPGVDELPDHEDTDDDPDA